MPTISVLTVLSFSMNKIWTWFIESYDQIMNHAMLEYQHIERKFKNFPWVFPECYDFPKNFHEFSRFSLIFSLIGTKYVIMIK